MPNLVGIGNSQVPTNGMLGGMAYQDPSQVSIDSFEPGNISQIKTVISQTAVSVFVYDTRKDTDGGAWRYKCTDKSWYKEPLNTEIRGSRREFPAVAILVLLPNGGSYSGTVDFIIYDADQAHCPMWMISKFNNGNGTNGHIHACNGIIAYSTTANGQVYFDFLLDRIRYHNANHRHSAAWIHPSRKDNSYKQWAELNRTGFGFASSSGYHVYCKVMPDAVDYEGRGLLMPDILFSHDSGMSQLKSDGTVYTHEYSSFTHRWSRFLSNNYIITAMDNSAAGKWIQIYPTLTANRTTAYNISDTNVYVHYNAQDQYRMIIAHTIPDENTGINHIEVTDNTDDVFFASNKGMGFATISTNSPEGTGYARMVHFVTKDFVTGYMMQRVSTAVLCGTQKKYNFNEARIYSTYGSGLRSANYTVEYSDDNSNWSVAFGGVMSNNTATGLQQGTKTTNNNITTKHRYWRYVVGTAVQGHHPRVSRIQLGEGSPVTTYHTIHQPTTDNTSDVGNIPSGSNNTIKVDTYQLGATNDRSAAYNRAYNLTNNRNDSGQLTVTPVEPGADLVGYSGWSDTAFLQQQYNYIDLANGGITIAFWAKTDISATGFIFDHAPSNASGSRFAVYYESGKIKFYTTNGSGTSEVATPTVDSAANPVGLANAMDDIWHHVVCTREPSGSNASCAHRMYVNGILRTDQSKPNRTLTNTSARMTIGHRCNVGDGADASNAFDGTIALLRISQDPASQAQVHKMWLREKQLFTENAKCLLSAEDSDRVFQMAYDTTTGSLHATNETGRDEFRGFVRLNNEGGQGQTSLGISASNGIVAAE